MTDTRILLAKITALRQRLEQAQGLASEARTAASALLEQVKVGDEHDIVLEEVVRPLTGRPLSSQPQTLTARARRILERGRELLGQIRQVADELSPEANRGPLVPLYRDTVAMIDTALRTVALLPESATVQMQLCRGLEITLDDVTVRLRTLTAGCQRQRQEEQQIGRLAGLLVALHAERTVDSRELLQLAGEVQAEASSCVPLGFLGADAADVPRWVACHSLTVARVLARIIRHDPELRTRSRDAIVAALVHDVGMLAVPGEVLAQSDELNDEQRRLIESHALIGAHLVARLFPDAPWLAEGVAWHHERLDGTGYPDGLKGVRLRALPRLLAVCDVYAALACPRPHRPARSTRTAMADTLLLAEQGQLDHHYAECLLSLSFYPVGSVVELTDGTVAVVVATPCARNDLNSPARPVVAQLTDSKGEALGRPYYRDLAVSEQVSIVRALSVGERREFLNKQFARWAA